MERGLLGPESRPVTHSCLRQYNNHRKGSRPQPCHRPGSQRGMKPAHLDIIFTPSPDQSPILIPQSPRTTNAAMQQLTGGVYQHTLANNFASPPLELIVTLRNSKSLLFCYFEAAGVQSLYESQARIVCMSLCGRPAKSNERIYECESRSLAICPSVALRF